MASFLFFFFLFSTLLKNLNASRIQTQIVGVEGKDADHYATTMAPWAYSLVRYKKIEEMSPFCLLIFQINLTWEKRLTLYSNLQEPLVQSLFQDNWNKSQ